MTTTTATVKTTDPSAESPNDQTILPSPATTPILNEELSPKQTLAIHALASGQRIHEAAEAAGVNRRTITRWLQQPTFRATLNYELAQTSQQTAIRSANATIQALIALERLVKSDNDPAIIIKAARAIFQHRPSPIKHGPTDPQTIIQQEQLMQLRHTIFTQR